MHVRGLSCPFSGRNPYDPQGTSRHPFNRDPKGLCRNLSAKEWYDSQELRPAPGMGQGPIHHTFPINHFD